MQPVRAGLDALHAEIRRAAVQLDVAGGVQLDADVQLQPDLAAKFPD